MRGRAFRSTLIAPTAVLAVLPLTARTISASLQQISGPITGATISVIEKPGAEVRVTVENERDSPLIECRINSPWMNYGSTEPIPPHERRTFSVHVDEARPATRQATLDYAVFEDGYYEGNGRWFDQWVADHQEHLEDLRYWVQILRAMPRISIGEMRRYFAERTSRQTHRLSHVSERVEDLLYRNPKGPYISRPIDQLSKDVEAEFVAASRAPSGDARSGPVDNVTAAVIVSAEATPSKGYAIVIENLREVAIEAFGLANIDPVSGQDKGGMSTDFCTRDPADHRFFDGRIQPHEKREYPHTFGNEVPVVRLSFVMFDDLVFQGDQAERERLLRNREDQADEYPLALVTLKQSLTKTPAQLEGFLIERRAEWLGRLQRNGRMPSAAGILESFLRSARRSPEQFLADAPSLRTHLEQQYQRLTRHLSAAREASNGLLTPLRGREP